MSLSTSNPFVGPYPLQRGQRLYGRDWELCELRDLLATRRVVLLHAPSGAGKTSLIQAGLISALERGFPDEDIEHRRERFRVLRVMIHREPPAEVLAAQSSFNRFVLSTLLSLDDGLPEDQRTSAIQLAQMKLHEYRAGRLVPSAPLGPDEKPLTDVLIFDQFEEILTIDSADLKTKQDFFEQLGRVLRPWPGWALFAIRDDYAAGLDPYLRPIPNRLSSRFPLKLLSKSAAKDAIREPARGTVVTFQPAAVYKLMNDLMGLTVDKPVENLEDTALEKLVDDMEERPVEPLHLQVVCKQIWQEQFDKSGTSIPSDAITPGTVDEALASYFKNEVSTAAEHDLALERRVRDWIESQLITKDHVRERVKQGEGTEGIAESVIERLIDLYLVRKEARRGGVWYELAHDRLITPIEKNNAEWRKEHLQPFQRRAIDWARSNQPPSLLLTAKELNQAQAWAQTHVEQLNKLDQDFLAKCRRARRKLLRRQTAARQRAEAKQAAARQQAEAKQVAEELRQKRRVQIFLCTTVVLLCVCLFIVLNFRTSAVIARRDAERLSHLNGGLAEIARGRLPAGIWSLFDAYAVSHGNAPKDNATLGLLSSWMTRLGRPLLHDGPVLCIGQNPTGTFLLTGSSDHTAQLWSIQDGHPVGQPLQHRGEVVVVAFDRTGQHALTASDHGDLKLYRHTDLFGELRETASFDQGAEITDACFSPDDKWLAASVSTEDTGYVTLRPMAVDSNGHREEQKLEHSSPVNVLAFSDDGRILAIGCESGMLHIWRHADGDDHWERQEQVLDLGTEISCVSFCPGTALLVVGGGTWKPPYGLAALMNVNETPQSAIKLVHNGKVRAAMFSPDGTIVATACADGAGRLWAANGTPIGPLLLHEYGLFQCGFSADGSKVLTASDDNSARVWDTKSGRMVEGPFWHSGSVYDAQFSRDQKRLITASHDGTSRLWVRHNQREMITQNGAELFGVAFDKDRELVTGGNDLRASVWQGPGGNDELLSSRLLRAFPHPAAVLSLAVSPDDRFLLTGCNDGGVRMWDFLSAKETIRIAHECPDAHFEHPAAAVRAVSFSSDGELLAFGCDNGYVHMMSARDGAPVRSWQAHGGSGRGRVIDVVAFSRDKKLVLSASRDASVKLWTVPSEGDAKPFAVLQHDSDVLGAVISHDGTWVVTGSMDQTVRVWEVKTGALLKAIPQQSRVMALAISADDASVVIGYADGTAKVLDTTLWVERGELIQTGDWARGVCFDRTATSVGTASFDGTAAAWKLVAPDIDNVSELQSAIEALTCYKRDAHGNLLRFSRDEWFGKNASPASKAYEMSR